MGVAARTCAVGWVLGWVVAGGAVLAPGVAEAHPKGFHKKVVLTVRLTSLEGLVVMDVDGSERTRGLRAAADRDGDRRLDAQEGKRLLATVQAMALRHLKVAVSGAPIPVAVKDAKLNLHGDHTVSDAGLSVALYLDQKHPHAVTPGLVLTVEDEAPDHGHVALEVHQAWGPDAGSAEPFQQELARGQRAEIRLGALTDAR